MYAACTFLKYSDDSSNFLKALTKNLVITGIGGGRSSITTVAYFSTLLLHRIQFRSVYFQVAPENASSKTLS